jgi:hypothetical protein
MSSQTSKVSNVIEFVILQEFFLVRTLEILLQVVNSDDRLSEELIRLFFFNLS